MIETKPWPGHPEEAHAALDAVTVELSLQEVTEAIRDYVWLKYPGIYDRCFVQFKTETGLGKKEISVRYTFWRSP